MTGTAVSSIAPDTEIAIPQTASDIEGIHDSSLAQCDSALMVDFIYADDTVSTVTVDILENELKGAIRNRRAEDGSWRITEFDELVETDTQVRVQISRGSKLRPDSALFPYDFATRAQSPLGALRPDPADKPCHIQR